MSVKLAFFKLDLEKLTLSKVKSVKFAHLRLQLLKSMPLKDPSLCHPFSLIVSRASMARLCTALLSLLKASDFSLSRLFFHLLGP